MDFGKLPIEQVGQVEFRLPPDHFFTAQSLGNQPVALPIFHVGCPVWANKTWLGKIYPTQAKEKDLLHHYTRQFNTIELNVTHYQIPTPETIERWKSQSATDFKFCPKFPQIISHDKLLQGCETLTEEFCRNILELDDYLGLPFLQLSPYFAPKHLPILRHYLQSIPPQLPLAVEFRHPDWFGTSSKAFEQAIMLLHDYGMTTVITDVAGRRDVVHQALPTPKVAIRWVGNEHPSDYERIDAWVARLKAWVTLGLKEIYIFVHINDNNLAPEMANYWIKQLNQSINCGLTVPHFMPRVVQQSLFY
jgi:uncharacterized protein YecE (DUF72 family)